MTCSLLTKMEQDGTRWNKVHMPWNPSTWFCDPSPPCPKLLPLPTSEPKGGRIPGLNPTIDPSITTTISELPCHQIHQLHVATPHTLKDLKVQGTPQTSPTTFWRPRACPGAWHSESAAVSGVPSLHPQLQGQPGHQGYPKFSKRCWEPFF